jgi:hypothetical protein
MTVINPLKHHFVHAFRELRILTGIFGRTMKKTCLLKTAPTCPVWVDKDVPIAYGEFAPSAGGSEATL